MAPSWAARASTCRVRWKAEPLKGIDRLGIRESSWDWDRGLVKSWVVASCSPGYTSVAFLLFFFLLIEGVNKITYGK